MNFIDDFCRIMGEITDAPEIFVRAGGYYIISVLCGVNVKCSITPSIDGTPPNDWFLISGVPGVTHRSTIVDEVLRIYKKTQKKLLLDAGIFAKDTEMTEKEIANTIVANSIVQRATPEGLMDALGKNDGLSTVYNLISGEWGGVIKAAKAKDYMVDYMPILSDLYYGVAQTTHRARKRDQGKGKKGEKGEEVREVKEGLYIMAFFSMQEPEQYLDYEILAQGLLRRIILIHCNPEEKEKFLPPLDFNRDESRRKLHDFERNLFFHAKKFRGNKKIRAGIPGEVFSEINRYSEIAEKRYIENQTSFNLYRHNFWEHLLKITIIEAMASHEPESSRYSEQGELILEVTMENYKTAYSFVEESLKRASPIIAGISTTKQSQSYKPAGGIFEMIESIIGKEEENGIDLPSLLRKSELFLDDLKKIIITLSKKERILIKQKTDDSLVFYLSDYKEELGGDFLPHDSLGIMW